MLLFLRSSSPSSSSSVGATLLLGKLFLLLLFVIFLSEQAQSNGDFDWVRDEFAEREKQFNGEGDDDAQFFDPTVIIGNRGVRSDDVLKYPLSKTFKRKDKLQVSECRACDISGLKVGCDQAKYIKPCGIEGSYALKSSYLEHRAEECGCGGRNTKIPLMASFVRDVACALR